MKSKANELLVLGWNIHGSSSMGGDTNLDELVVDEILDGKINKPDIIVINEFVVSIGWDYFQLKLIEHNYIWFMTYTSSENGVLIAINRNIKGLSINKGYFYSDKETVTTKMKTKEKVQPNFLQIKLKVNKVNIYIIGTRIMVETDKNTSKEERKNFKINQFNALRDHLDSIKDDGEIICIGDFNVSNKYLQTQFNKNFHIATPSHDKSLYNTNRFINNYSYFFTHGETKRIKGFRDLDHLLTTKNIELCNIRYSWDFMNEIEYDFYPKDIKKAETIWSIPVMYPDHAKLMAKIKI